MRLRQGPQLHKACSVRGAVLHTVIVVVWAGAGEHHRLVCLLVAINCSDLSKEPTNVSA